MVLKFLAIITPKNSHFLMELDFNGVIEVLNNRENLRFIGDKVDPGKMSMIINESFKPSLPR